MPNKHYYNKYILDLYTLYMYALIDRDKKE